MRYGRLMVLPSALLLSMALLAAAPAPQPSVACAGPRFERLPLAFEANRGQSPEPVRFLARGGQGAVFLTPTEAVITRGAKTLQKAGRETVGGQAQPAVLRISLDRAYPSPVLRPEGDLPGRVNYFLGNDPSRWIEGIPTTSKVRYCGVYPGVDMVFYGKGSQLEYDFVVAPGVRPETIALRFRSARGRIVHPVLNTDGALILKTPSGDFIQHSPRAWQQRGAEKVPVESAYLLKERGKVGFRLGPYDRSLPLTIDPTLGYSTYLGGSSSDGAEGVAVDSLGNVVVTGQTMSADFPVTDGSLPLGSNDVFVAKLGPTESGLSFCTIFGGSSSDRGRDVALDASGNIYVTGETGSPAFPVLHGFPFSPGQSGDPNAFLTRLSSGGTIDYSTLIQGGFADSGAAVAMGSPGFAYVAGTTQSSDFLTAGGAQQEFLQGPQDAFLTLVDTNSVGTLSIPYSTYLGGLNADEATAVATDSFNHIFLAGQTSSTNFPGVVPGVAYQSSLATPPDGFLCELTIPMVGGAPFISYASYLGGNGTDVIEALAASGPGGVCVAGFTGSTNFPLVGPFQGSFGGGSTDAFFSIFNTISSGVGSLTYSTYFGGLSTDFVYGLALDPDGNPLLAGTTGGSDTFPIVNPLPGMGDFQGGYEDAFVARIVFPIQRPEATTSSPTLWMSTFLGGSGDDYAEAIAFDPLGNIVVVGATASSDFPTLNPLQSPGGMYDAFITKISLEASPCSVTCTAGVSPASGLLTQPFTFSSTVTPSDCIGTPETLWDFGDGATSTFANPIHVYSSLGTFEWSLTVTVEAVPCVQTGSVTVTACTPICTASADATSGFAPLGVNFSGSVSGCTGTPAYDWNFGDGSPHSASANPSHTYLWPGSYTWTLTATLDGICSRTGTVTILDPLQGVPVAWGFNSYGQAGDVAANQSSVPAAVPGLAGLTGLSAGYYHILAVSADGTVRAWGSNAAGQLGNGTINFSSSPQLVPGVSGASAVAGGGYHSLAVVAGGAVKAWGYDYYGQLGDGATGVVRLSPVSVLGLAGVTAVAAGWNHSLALKSDGTVWAWGYNARGQLGDGTTVNRSVPVPVSGLVNIVAIAAGSDHSLALRNDGIVFAWGYNAYGQLGNGTSIDSHSPAQVGGGLIGVTAIACGRYHSVAATSGGTVAVWGNNSYGQIGDGTHNMRYSPYIIPSISQATAVGAGWWHTLVAKTDGSVLAWGNDWFGECGGGPFDQKTTPVVVAGASGVARLTAGWGFSLARKGDGTALAWGLNDMGQFGNGRSLMRLTPAAIAGLANANAVALGAMHGLALRPDGTVGGWGDNEEGQLGTGGQSFSSPLVTAAGLSGVSGIASGYFFSLAVKQDGTVWSWGNGPHGDGTYARRLLPGQVPGLTGFTAVAAGMDHCLALKSDGTVYAWGDNPQGQLGDGTTTVRYTPIQIQGFTGVVAIASNDTAEFSMALKGDGTVWVWGDNAYGQLGDGTTTDRHSPIQVPGLSNIRAIAAGGNHALALDDDGIVHAWGLNFYGQVGDGSNTNRLSPVIISGPSLVTMIAAGDMHSLALASDGSVWGWGANFGGQTGSGNTAAQLVPVASSHIPGATAIAAGGDASMALLTCTVACDAEAPSSAVPGEPVTFTSSVTPGPACSGFPVYAWTFGDSGTSVEPSPVHNYAAQGSYSWRLTVTLDGATCTKDGNIDITSPCTLDCTATGPASGITGQTLTFTATATPTHCAGQVAYSWNFGDGTVVDGTDTATHTYGAAGTYAWTMTAVVDGVSCTRGGTVQIAPSCSVTCDASAAPLAGTTETAFTFTATLSTTGCTGTPFYEWDFGDGSMGNHQSLVTHTYTSQGVYTWRLWAVVDGVSCTKSGRVLVAPTGLGSLQGFVGICGAGQFVPLEGAGVSSLEVYALDTSGNPHDAVVVGPRYLFPLLSPGVYQVYAEFDYLDNITVGNHDLPNAGCDAPGAVVKHFKSKPMAHTVTAGVRDFANLCLPPPLVLLHGTLQCYEDWNAWESAALSEGFIVFTPNYRWWHTDASWAQRADQVMDQLLPDFEGLVGPLVASPQNTEAAPPPWALVGYDMGGLVARVMASGRHRRDPLMDKLMGIVLLGVPNSGTNLLPGVAGNAMSVAAIVRRFNPQYPNFGDKTSRVYAIGGNKDWWQQRNSDGRVSLYSAFNVTLLACSPTAFGSPACRPFPALTFNSGDGHIFSYNHKELASSHSIEEILKGVILPAVQAESMARAELANDDEGIGDPGSPAGMGIWGTNGRTSGSAQGSYPPGSVPVPEGAYPHSFTVSRTDGMGVVVFVSQGSGLFRVLNASGTEVASATVDGDWEYYKVAPDPGEWTLEVTPGSDGVTFLATFVEDGTFGVNGYFTLDSYSPGGTARLRLDLEGDPSGLTGAAATAAILNPDGTPYQTVTLFDDGQHGDGGMGDGNFGASITAPAIFGAYATIFTLTGTYLTDDVVRLAEDTLTVLPATHLFTGAFSDAPEDRDADGRYDALLVTAQVALPSAGTFVVSGDLLDAAGNTLDHAAASQTASGPEAVDFGLTFDLRGILCLQFGQPFAVANLRVLDGATLLPVDGWPSPVPTNTYLSGDFECQPGTPKPTLAALRSDEGVKGQTLSVLVGGSNFKPGASLTFDSGISAGQVLWVAENLLVASVTVDPSASLGPHAATVTNPDASSDTLLAAFTVREDQPPTVSIQTPRDGTLIDPATEPSVLVSAAASDDIRVSRVDFLLNGALQASDGDFPFTWNLPAASVPSGATTLTARAYDSIGQHADASVTLLKDPPTVTSVTGGGSPWKLKVMGTNFRSGITATIGSDPQPWTNVVYKSSVKIQIKGGKALKAKFPQGQPVDIRLRNPDGTEVTAVYRRP